MPAQKKVNKTPEIEILGTQQKKTPGARQVEIRKTGEYIRAHKQANSGKIRKAS
jgi:hypothetical protein